MEYSKPIMDFVEKGDVKDPNNALQLAMLIWNYNLSQKRDNPDNQGLSRTLKNNIFIRNDIRETYYPSKVHLKLVKTLQNP